ncbi:universal stress protein [Amycolatopsis anabasis]|uniref:universal stress protein n=1 Tax=Amycolatopsis anabasis TaxID=1840409 RepID=UPI001FEACB90|nr:universal stress protein [Amycolatopsis anabasis]
MKDTERAMRGYLASSLYTETHPGGEPGPHPSVVDERVVLAGIDGSEFAVRAARWAAREAARRSIPLRLVHVCAPLYPGMVSSGSAPAKPEDILVRQGRNFLRAAAAASVAAEPAVRVREEVLIGSPAKTLIEQTASAELAVLGSRGRVGLDRLLTGSVADAVATHGRCPIAVIRTEPDPGESRPVVVGVDDSADGEAALAYAFEECAATKAPLIAVRSWRDPSADDAWSGIPSTIDLEQIEAGEERGLNAILDAWRKRYPEVTVTSTVVRSNRPADAVLRAAKNARLIVVGSHGRGVFTRALLGSTSRTVLHHAESPVVVAHPAVESAHS